MIAVRLFDSAWSIALAKFDARSQAYEDQTRVSAAVYVVMLVIAAAFAAFVWNLYVGQDSPPRITPPPGAYKTAPPSELPVVADAGEQGEDAAASAATAPAGSAPAQSGAARLTPTPSFAANGPYVAQIAALQSEAGVEPAWARLSSRAPQLFAGAHLDVERADLGQRGVYFRVRAGYFADRENARRFCDRITQMGQDCIVVNR
ncbi:MAG TPA: SPOR domain-containing protein [Caulobacterales bacterium]|nr:SPOR domain-containing protein [Caulobacterales bacterium]